MNREIRSLAARHPFEVRFRARELYLRGISVADLPEVLGRELDEKNALAAQAAGQPVPPPVERISARVVKYWFDAGHWATLRKSTERIVLKAQVERIRREFSERMRIQAARIRLNQTFVEKHFWKPELDPKTGNPLVRVDGTPQVTIKTPADTKMEMTDVVRLHQAGIKLDMEQLKMAGDMIGGLVPKVSMEDFTLGMSPPPLPRAARPELTAPEEPAGSPSAAPEMMEEPVVAPPPKRPRKAKPKPEAPPPEPVPEPPKPKKRKRRKP